MSEIVRVNLSSTVSYELVDQATVLTIDNPPVNGLGDTVRHGIFAGVAAAEADEKAAVIIIMGAGKMFCAGADIRQLKSPAALSEPILTQVIARIESSRKPVIAAMHGNALGGGFELALGCHYRIAHRDTKIGLPEIKLGLIPGAGGTQRVTRLSGIAGALEIIMSGERLSAERAEDLRLIDRVTDDDVLKAALDFASTLSARSDHPLVSALPSPADTGGLLAIEKQRLAKQRRAGKAEFAALESIEAAVSLPFAEGWAVERKHFLELREGVESKALRHIFLAERETSKFGSGDGVASSAAIDSVAVIGAGTMGAGIAMTFVDGGIPVRLIDLDAAALDRAMARIRSSYSGSVAKGRLTESDMLNRLSLIAPGNELKCAADADLVVEAVFEDMEAKKHVFRELDRLCKAEAILATNTSRLDVNEIATVTSRSERFIGLHFFSPANIMRLLEIVKGAKTPDGLVRTCLDLARRINKIPVVVGVGEGFVGNRMLTPYRREAEFLLEEGASPMQVDRALETFGMAMGPFAMADLAGLDIAWSARKRLAAGRRQDLRYCAIPDRLCEQGRFGQKTSAGYYRYAEGSRKPLSDPEVEALIQQCAREAGIERRTIEDSEIVERCSFALVNEGASVLDDGIAQRASDIDVVYVNGFGFPATRGGPMFYADTVGLATVVGKIEEWSSVPAGNNWVIPSLLRSLARDGKTFSP